ncbi:hypothetical protein ED92_22830 [Amycolatopsis sp. MJM2582]|uniref:hypothetical protein n=1 Tax=Amycolatopsis sp. MJM2582 TaxID=1427749 RepID=UPI0005074D4A|nr:hypothetical protein [Amycolatopsis sp. MJM2582]KFZ80199.1 hypothetical protein ED92_22830 [Amycolatopsis sp. MJM2582]
MALARVQGLANTDHSRDGDPASTGEDTATIKRSPWRCEPGYPNCTKAQSHKYLADLEYQKCRRDPEKIWDTGTQKCRYKTSGEVQSEYYSPTTP